MDAHEFLVSVGGVAKVSLLKGHGYGPAELRKLDGAYQPRHGIWALPSADKEYLSALVHNGYLTCASAAVRYGLWLKDQPTRLHLATRHNRGGGFIRHGGLRLGSEGLLPVASLEDTVIHALTCLSDVDAIAMAESAMKKCGVARDVLESELTANYFGNARRRLRMADGLSESVPEISARILFEAEGLSFKRQVRIPGVGRVDTLVDDWLIVEVNGYKFHSSRAAWRKDMGRLNAAQALGFQTLAFAPEEIWNSPDEVMAQIRRLLARGKPQARA
ncbi:endonuclease domain-containing protein [Paenarthrobacter ilicis]|uniref:endonuclease domain-containing protein n=1 Tax=Paenarthrobacter ilicis TaxID=43665 RepID=UPI0038670C5D